MTIRVKGFFSIKDAMGGKAELEVDVRHITIREILIDLSKRYGDKFKENVFDPKTNEVYPENQILVNGRHYRYLEKGLDTQLENGDFLAIFPQVAGG